MSDRNAAGKFTFGNRAALVVGARSAQFWAAADDARAEIVDAVCRDKGLSTRDAPTTLLSMVDGFAQAALVRHLPVLLEHRRADVDHCHDAPGRRIQSALPPAPRRQAEHAPAANVAPQPTERIDCFQRIGEILVPRRPRQRLSMPREPVPSAAVLIVSGTWIVRRHGNDL